MEPLSQNVFSFFALVCLLLRVVTAIGQNATIAFDSSEGSLLLGTRQSHVNLILDAADWPGVLRVANDLAVDFGRVTGVNGTVSVTGKAIANASMIFNITGRSSWEIPSLNRTKGEGNIIAGTIGNSSYIDKLIKDGTIDVSQIKGKWEAFQSQIVHNPTNGTDKALVIVGK